MKPGGKIFISAAGYDTEYGLSYPGRTRPVKERFCHVTPDMQGKHAIFHKIVTYKEEELTALLGSAGFGNVQATRSTFGNIKAKACKL